MVAFPQRRRLSEVSSPLKDFSLPDFKRPPSKRRRWAWKTRRKRGGGSRNKILFRTDSVLTGLAAKANGDRRDDHIGVTPCLLPSEFDVSTEGKGEEGASDCCTIKALLSLDRRSRIFVTTESSTIARSHFFGRSPLVSHVPTNYLHTCDHKGVQRIRTCDDGYVTVTPFEFLGK